MSFLNRFLEGRPQDDTLSSVVRNLTHLLNSKSGYGSPLLSFGLGDYYKMPDVHATAESVMNEVLRDIGSYEPRLRAIEFKVLNDQQLPLAFELRGELRLDRGRPMAPRYEMTPCKLAILFDPYHGEVAVHVIELAGEVLHVR
jgi:predicted component of type VI protein secretion system